MEGEGMGFEQKGRKAATRGTRKRSMRESECVGAEREATEKEGKQPGSKHDSTETSTSYKGCTWDERWKEAAKRVTEEYRGGTVSEQLLIPLDNLVCCSPASSLFNCQRLRSRLLCTWRYHLRRETTEY
jgi:hypothetical protein